MASGELTEVMRGIMRPIQASFIYFAIGIIILLFGAILRSPVLAAEISTETQSLFEFVRTGNMNGVERSISLGADWNMKNEVGLTPVDVAVNYNNFKIAHYLLSLRKRYITNPFVLNINNFKSLDHRSKNEIKKSDLLEEMSSISERKTLTKKSIKPYQPKNSQNILLESEVSNKTHLLSRKNQIISSISGVEFAETEIKQKNNVLLESYDGLSGFLYNTTEATKRSLEQKKSEVTDVPKRNESTFSSAKIVKESVISEPLTRNEKHLEMERSDPKKIDLLTSFLFETIDKTKWIATINDSEKPEKSKDQNISYLSVTRPVKAEKAPSVEVPMIKKESSSNVIDIITDFFSGTIEDAQELTIEGAPIVEVASPPKIALSKSTLKINNSDQSQNIDSLLVEKESKKSLVDRFANFFSGTIEDAQNLIANSIPVEQPVIPADAVSSRPVSKSDKSNQVIVDDNLVIETAPSDGLIDRLASFYFNTTEKTERTLKKNITVIPKPSLAVKVDEHSKSQFEKVKSIIFEVESNSAKIISIPSTKLEEPTKTIQAGLGVKKANINYNMDKRIIPVLGESLRLGKRLKEASNNICINKGPDKLRFCVEDVNWPSEIATAFKVRTKLFQGTQALVEYSKGQVRQVHVPFLASYFDAVVTYYTKRLGGAGRGFDNWAILPAEPNRKNPTIRWRGAGNSILEIRQIDDLRWSSLPLTKHGVIRIYFDDPAPIFRFVSWSDFTLARMLVSQKRFCKEANVKPCPW